MSNIQKSINVNVPVRTAFNQWAQFEEFPRFMEGVDWLESPAGMIRRFSEELDRIFTDFGMGRNLFGSCFGRERGLEPQM
jgi:hypothetical protein